MGRPHVLSGDYAFRFDLASNGLLGYILPEALDAPKLAALPPAARRASVPAHEQAGHEERSGSGEQHRGGAADHDGS